MELLEYLWLMMMTPSDARLLPLTAFDYTRAISTANIYIYMFMIGSRTIVSDTHHITFCVRGRVIYIVL